MITGYFPVRAKHSGDKFSILITGYFPVRAKHSGEKLSILITGYFPNASPLLRPYDS
ncbi:hypothetical protein H5968_07450 [Sphaerospermopsis sp. LEGE 00249]|uniref:hypothetical protein n=1 Tax=Sphaerospermopsis sp. LEGE 00249 TaxID=1380707 RepID=UPI00164E8A4D|nr:hypothetical protein [Sphaerospermopsis sp. LEGE 00249]MBC5794987.1 hypothetical protein [Sphaerospermopsis sp. LEGE 00249]